MSDFRYTRASRLLKPAAFQAVFDARKASRGRWLTVHRIEVKPESASELPASTTQTTQKLCRASRLGLIVAKRLVPTAARRNLIRRVLREYFRTTPVAFPPGDWIIRLHASPFSASREKNHHPPDVLTRRQIVSKLRCDLAEVLGRLAVDKANKADKAHQAHKTHTVVDEGKASHG